MSTLNGLHIIVTAGPTYEPIDPVRFIGNRSSGKQGYAIAESLAKQGAKVTLISGPTALPDPDGVTTIRIETAKEMLNSCENVLPADIAICAAAVADWAPKALANHKIKKRENHSQPAIELVENPDILKTLSNHSQRPDIVIGFAAETENLEDNARAKIGKKSCDFILANLVQSGGKSVFGNDENHVYLIDKHSTEDWGQMSKSAIADRLCDVLIEKLKTK